MTVQVGCTNGFGGCVFPALTASRNPRLESCPPVPSEGHRDDRSTHGRRAGLDVGGPQTNACPPPVRRERTSPPARDSTNEGTCQRIVPANVRHTTWSIGSRELDPRRPCCKCSRHPMAFTPPVVVSTRRLAEPRPSHPTLLHPKRSCCRVALFQVAAPSCAWCLSLDVPCPRVCARRCGRPIRYPPAHSAASRTCSVQFKGARPHPRR